MKALNRKLLRDLRQIKGQAIAIALVIACGLATFVMSLCTYTSLDLTREAYYERYRFAHIFANLKRAPDSLIERIRAIPGVAQVQTRVVRDVTLDVPGLPEPAVGRLISLTVRNQPALNEFYLRAGRRPEPGHRDEVLASEAFANSNNLEPGDTIKAVINGKLQQLRIVGIALSPEYIIQIRGGEILPDDRRFGVLWMDHQALSTVFNMEGAFNDVTLTMRRGASEPEILQRLDLLIQPYGGVRSYGRDDQISYRFLADELQQLRGTAVVAPSIFLGVAAFLLNVVLSRIVSAQREQIAMLKAFGYSSLQVATHYLKLVLLVVLCGAILGTLMGIWLGQSITALYATMYRFPLIVFRIDPRVVIGGLFLCLGMGVLGTLQTLRKAGKLPPAEAMRPEPPASFKPTIVERLGMQALLSQAGRMILRQLERHPTKTSLSVVGIALAVAVLVLGRCGIDAVHFLMEHQFSITQRQDITVSLFDQTQEQALYDIRNLPGVLHAEPFRSVPVKLRNGPRSQELALQGIDPDGSLFRVTNAEARPVPLPPEGLVISEQLATMLAIQPGEIVAVEVLDGRRQQGQLAVTATVSDFAGTNAYINRAALNEFLQETPSISGAYLDVDPAQTETLYRQLKQTPFVAGASVLKTARDSFLDTIGENILKMTFFNVLFACVIAFGVVYNTARISLAERSRELATLRVMGFTRAEVSAILLGELAIITLAAIPLGLAMGYFFAYLLTSALQTELYRIPLVVEPWTFGFAASVVLVASLVSGLIVRRQIDHFDLIAVLKARD